MGKKKRGKPNFTNQPSKNKVWSKAAQFQKKLSNTLMSGSNPSQTSSQAETFQAPDHQQDSILDLTDDTSPNIPMAKPAGSQEPGNSGSHQKQQKTKTNSPIVLGLNTVSQNKLEEKNRNAATTSQDTTANVAKSTAQSTSGLIIGRSINTRITRVTPTPAKPQQYRLPAPQSGFPSNQQTESQLVLPSQTGSKGSEIYTYSYPKGIPKSFLVRPTDPDNQQPENPYSSMIQNMVEQAQVWPPPPLMLAPTFVPTEPNSFVYNFNPPEDTPNPTLDPKSDKVVEQQAYSPSDVYTESVMNIVEESQEGSESSDLLEAGQKRLSAFRRLGPLTQPKKPKMTISLQCDKDQSVREVVDETENKYVPVHLREDIINSTDETVAKYLKFWPWEKGLPIRKTVMARTSKSVMLLEHEQMEELYEKDYLFIRISVQGYPRDWTKEKLLDTLLDVVNGKSFIPVFIEFAPHECKFLVIRSRSALNALHSAGLIVRTEGAELSIAISQTELTVNKVDFIPKLILRKRLSIGYDGERSLDLSNFTTKEDISHFIYYPLNRVNNQSDLIQLKSTVVWNYLTELNLSRNRLTSLEGFNLPLTTPKLRHLDLSYNRIEKATLLLRCRQLVLHSLKLEGNPLCRDYTDPARYVTVLKMMFPALMEIDGTPIQLRGEIPKFYRNYCPEDSRGIIDKFLEVYFQLLDTTDKDRAAIQQLYDEKASMTITYRYKLRYSPIYRQFRTIFHRSRVIDEGDTDSTDGAEEIVKVINKWPPLKHDPFTFTVDVLHHDDHITIFKVAGVLKLTSESLADDEHLLSFTRTFVIRSLDSIEYKITNEMVYWDQPTAEYANTAFQITTVRPKLLSFKIETPPDEDIKEKLIEVSMKLTELDRSASERCLEHKNWNFKTALEYFMKLLKLDEIEILSKELL